VVFPGGVGTAEEILYLLGILLNEKNRDVVVPLVFTGPESSRYYMERLHAFIGETLGEAAQAKYKIILDDPPAVAREVAEGLEVVRRARSKTDDAYFFNWQLDIGLDYPRPSQAT